jgi:hypothetical protein
METELINQIVQSLETWNEPQRVGEEVRAMTDTLIADQEDEVYFFLLNIIESNPNDYDLGKAIRRIYIPLKTLVNDKGSPERNNEA